MEKKPYMYYKNNFKRNRFSNRFSNRRSFSNGPRRDPRRSKLEGADINMFIKKAAPMAQEEEFIVQNSFADFNISDILQRNILKHGYTQPTPIQSQAIKPIL